MKISKKLNLFMFFTCVPFFSLFGAGKSGSGMTNFVVSTPWVFNLNQMSARAELNMSGKFSIGLEAIKLGERTQNSDKYEEEFGRELTYSGEEALLTFSRYSQPAHLAGFYWTIGAGYRRVNLTGTYKDPEAYLVSETDSFALNENGSYDADMVAEGTTGHVRIGYRYLMSSTGLLIGGYLGVQHFERSLEPKDEEAEFQLTDEESVRIKNQLQTMPAFAAEFALAF